MAGRGIQFAGDYDIKEIKLFTSSKKPFKNHIENFNDAFLQTSHVSILIKLLRADSKCQISVQ